MKTVIVSAFAALLVVIGASPVVAQQPTDAEINEYIELVRMDVRQGRADLIGQHHAALGQSGCQVLADLRGVRDGVHVARRRPDPEHP